MKKPPIQLKRLFILFSLLGMGSFTNAQNVGIGTATPSAKLHVNGSLKITNGTEGLGKVLTSDKNGAADWQAISSSQTGGLGFGAWGDCNTRNISGYHPVADSAGAAYNYFGGSVGISGNYAIVGAGAKTVEGNANQGVAFIYFFDGTTWMQQQILTASDGTAQDYFASSVSINGNYAIVGARNKTVSGNTGQGKAYIFFNNGSSWIQVGSGITASDGGVDDKFGISVNINGNYAIVGAYYKTVGGINAQGKAYIFNNVGGNWLQVGAGITASDGETLDNFGVSVSIHGNNAIVGASNKMVNGNFGQGKAYIFNNMGGSWVQVGTGITPVDGAEQDVFGCGVSIFENYAIVGSFFKTVGSNVGQGAAYIYFYNGSNWVFWQKLTANDGEELDKFGASVCIKGNYAMVGAYSKMVGANVEQGAAYVYQNIAGVWRFLQKVTDPGGTASDFFGGSVGIDDRKFLIGASGVQVNRGMAFFGKVEQ